MKGKKDNCTVIFRVKTASLDPILKLPLSMLYYTSLFTSETSWVKFTASIGNSFCDWNSYVQTSSFTSASNEWFHSYSRPKNTCEYSSMCIFFTLGSYITRRRAGNRIGAPGQLGHVSNWAEALPTLTALTLLAAADFRVLLLQLTKTDYQETTNCCCVTKIAESTSQIHITIYHTDRSLYGLIPS